MTGLIRQRLPLPVLLYLLAVQRLVVWDAPDRFAVLQPPAAAVLPPLVARKQRVAWLRRLDRWWEFVLMWGLPFLALLVAVFLAVASARLRTSALLTVLGAVLYTVTAMLVPLLYGLLKLGRRLATGETPYDHQASQQIMAHNWCLALFHGRSPDQTGHLLRRTLAEVATISRPTRYPAKLLVCDIRCVTISAAADAMRTDPIVAQVPDSDLLIVRIPGQGAPSAQTEEDSNPADPMSFVVLFLFAIVIVVAFLAHLVAQQERAACKVWCEDRPTSYWAALYWLLSQLTFRGDPHGLSPATSQAQIAGLLMVLLGVTLLGVVLAAGVQIARIHRNRVRKLKEHIVEEIDKLDWAAYGNLFINYRQGPERLLVEALGRELARYFGRDKVFLDIHSIPPGDRYPDDLWEKLDACTVLLAVVHRDWLRDLTNRLTVTGTDWVRYEISTALEKDKMVIPLLLDDATLPGADELPTDLADLADLAHRQACRLRWGSFEADFNELTKAIEPRLRVRAGHSVT